MATPLQSRQSSPDELKNIEEFLSGINSQAIISGIEKMATSRTGKIRLDSGEKNASKAHQRITLRLTPELQQKWVSVIEELSQAQGKNLNEVKKRASGEFAAAFKDGQLVIEVKEDGKRTAYASEKTAENIQNGKILLKKNGNQTIAYDSIKVIDSAGFTLIANTFITNMLAAAEPSATLTSESITSGNPESKVQASAQTGMSKVVVQKSPEKKVTITQSEAATPEKTEAQKRRELEKQEEKLIEAERDRQHALQSKEREKDREEDKVQAAEDRQEDIREKDKESVVQHEETTEKIKEATVVHEETAEKLKESMVVHEETAEKIEESKVVQTETAEKIKEGVIAHEEAKVIEAMKAEETAPSDPAETVT